MWSKVMQWAQDLSSPVQDSPIQLQEQAVVRVLFVCLGNTCRSPMAEGAFRRLLQDVGLANKVYVDSAGTHSFHLGVTPDKRSQQTASRRGIDLSSIRARRVVEEDFAKFDYVLAMDRDNLEHLFAMCIHLQQRKKVHLLMEFAPDLPEQEVPDPYYGGLSGFERVMDLLEVATEGLLCRIRERYRL
jgi:protein-tyrosine phosphatase